MSEAEKILNKVFGFKSFLPLQSEIIENTLAGRDSLIIMPTGGGKSLCYQVPALLFNGITIVISPLISLMKDQVAGLNQLGIDACLLNSSMTPKEYEQNYFKALGGKAKLIYAAPESLGKQALRSIFKKNKVCCIAVDEAHCISEWGHDFRKEYRQLGDFRKEFPDAVCMALTATATPRVQNDIVVNLNLRDPGNFIASFDRKNLFLEVIKKNDPYEQTIRFLGEHKNESGIIYCFSRKQVDDLSYELAAEGYSVKPYHAGLTDEERHKNQDLFTRDEVQIIVATIAFGMGINKSNVRFVIHYDLPKNLESYYQEIGRSGRDGMRADCLLLFSYGDISKIKYFIDQKEDEQERRSAKLHLQDMVKYAEAPECRRIKLITYFGESYYQTFCGMCDNCTEGDTEKADVTIAAQKFLSAVKRTGERFGTGYIIDLLSGTESDKIFRNGHQNISVYGIGKEFNKQEWKYLADQFIVQGLLVKDMEFGGLHLTEKAVPVLRKESKVLGKLRETPKEKKVIKLEYDQALFDKLKTLRKQIADENNVPAYLIFSDKTLSEMAVYYPTEMEELSRITGVGSVKMKQYGTRVLSLIKKYCSENNISKKRITGTGRSPVKRRGQKSEMISEAFKSGATVETLSGRYNIKKERVIYHFSNYVEDGGVLPVERLSAISSVPPDKKQEIFKFLSMAESEALKPVFDHMNGEIPYEELRLLRLVFNIKKRDKSKK